MGRTLRLGPCARSCLHWYHTVLEILLRKPVLPQVAISSGLNVACDSFCCAAQRGSNASTSARAASAGPSKEQLQAEGNQQAGTSSRNKDGGGKEGSKQKKDKPKKDKPSQAPKQKGAPGMHVYRFRRKEAPRCCSPAMLPLSSSFYRPVCLLMSAWDAVCLWSTHLCNCAHLASNCATAARLAWSPALAQLSFAPTGCW